MSQMLKTVLITGATSGIGEATAIRLAKEKFKLILLGRNQGKLEQLQKGLEAQTEIFCVNHDLQKFNELMPKLSERPDSFKDIDVLINNAGLALGLETAQQAKWNDWNTVLDTNIKAATHCINALLPSMVKRNCGYIINIGSIAGSWPYPGGNVYGATKAYLKQLSFNLRADLLGTQVRVTNIEPGLTETNFSMTRFKGDSKKADAVYENKNALQPEDMANMIAWLLSQPVHVNINSLEVMPTSQAFGPLPIAVAE